MSKRNGQPRHKKCRRRIGAPKTIFMKLMQLSLSVILASSIVLGVIHFYLINRYMNASQLDMLGSNAQRINQLVENLAVENTPMVHRLFQINIDAIAQNTGSHIVMTDREGLVIYTSSQARQYLSALSTLPVDAVKGALDGETVVRRNLYDNVFGERTLTVASPLGGDERYGLILLTVPAPPVSKEVMPLLSLLFTSIVASIAVAMVLSYFLSANMSHQIRTFSTAAREIARGQFSKRSERSNVRELQELGASFDIMAEELEKQDQVRTTFIANVSHDLRTPMTTIGGFVQGMLDGTIPPEKQSDYLAVVLSETKRLSDLVNTFLDLSRYESGEIVLQKAPVEINETLRGVLMSFESVIQAKNIQVRLAFDRERAMVFVDELAMQRVLVNLIDNATKFVQPGGTIEIAVVRKKGKTFVSVENSGAELSNEQLKFIWDRFYKADQSRKYGEKGTGLGLFIVKNIVHQHNEKILVESKDGHVKFTVTMQNAKS